METTWIIEKQFLSLRKIKWQYTYGIGVLQK